MKKRVIIGCSGSVASIKIPLLYSRLSRFADVKIVTTNSALHFFSIDEIRNENENENNENEVAAHLRKTVFTDNDEWLLFSKIGDPVLHIELRRWADILILAPLSANTLAKIATGQCDNLLTCLVRAWDWNNKILMIAPSMNNVMWDHPITLQQINIVRSFATSPSSMIYLPPIAKKLACNEIGIGAMAEVDTIVNAVLEVINRGNGDIDNNIN